MLSQSQNKKKYLNETTTMSIVSLNFYKKKRKKKKKLQMLVPVTDSDRECSSLSESSNWSSLENNK